MVCLYSPTQSRTYSLFRVGWRVGLITLELRAEMHTSLYVKRRLYLSNRNQNLNGWTVSRRIPHYKISRRFELSYANMRTDKATCAPRELKAPEKWKKIDLQDPEHKAVDEEDNCKLAVDSSGCTVLCHQDITSESCSRLMCLILISCYSAKVHTGF
jgi:hypothetical protein